MTVGVKLPQSVPLPVNHLELLWKNLADKYFSNRLPPIKIEWSSRLTASTGLFVSHVGPRDRQLNRVELRRRARVIRLSSPLLHKQPASEIVRTLAHEMIHQWQYDVKRCRPTHGPEFLKFMARMNCDGLGITIRHSLNQEVEAFTKYVWQCTKCGESYRRQRRSISPHHHRCGSCYGSLREVSLDIIDQFQGRLALARRDHKGGGENQTTVKFKDHPRQLVFDFVEENGQRCNH